MGAVTYIMRETAHTFGGLHRSLAAQGSHEWLFLGNAYHTSPLTPLPNTKLSKAWLHLIALLIAQTTVNSPKSPNTSKRTVSTELESFLKELAAELHITPEAAEQIWKSYHPEQEATHDEPQKLGSLSGLDRSFSAEGRGGNEGSHAVV